MFLSIFCVFFPVSLLFTLLEVHYLINCKLESISKSFTFKFSPFQNTTQLNEVFQQDFHNRLIYEP